MLQVEKKESTIAPFIEKPYNDIIIKRLIPTETVNEDGSITKGHKYKEVNITRLVNETAKVVKVNNTQETLKKLEEIFTKK